MPMLLCVNNLSVHFGSGEKVHEALSGISFEMESGEALGLVGESGSGKSVTALSIMRLLQSPPARTSGGQILYAPSGATPPIDLLRLPEREMRRFRGKEIAMIFQEPMSSLNPVMRCGQQVTEAIRAHLGASRAEAKQRALALFERVRLPEPLRAFNAYPHQLSGGQKQRVMIAMALSCQPKILIADEPTTALDVSVQRGIVELLADLRRELGTSILFITHDLGLVAEIADRVAVMQRGKIVESGTIAEVFGNPRHPYTQGLLACRPPLEGRIKRLPTVADFLDGNIALEGARFAPVGIAAQREKVANLTSQSPLVEVDALRAWFPKSRNWWGRPTEFVKAVDDVSFNVYKGETLGLVGESGCGKTTLGRCLLCLANGASGSVRFEGHDISALQESEMRPFRKKMQIIFQDPYASLNPRMAIGNAIAEPMKVHNLYATPAQRKEKTVELLETVGLSADHHGRYPHELSGGQRQRASIARALAIAPSFIVCDEAVSALDVSVQAQVLNLLLDLQEKFGLTYVFISHDLSVVKFMSDRMLVMRAGKIEELGLAEDVYNEPKSSYTRQLIEAVPKGRW
jgi:peptide/nickel transport system ATP-binding protein